MNLKSKTVLVYDQGAYIHICSALVGHFDRVLLYVPYQEQWPGSYRMLIGTGIPGVERICPLLPGKNKGLDFWDVVKDVDLFIFPGAGSGDIQEELRRQGKRVWGSGHGDDLELFRFETKELLKSLGIEQAGYEKVIGTEALKARLKNESGTKHIKLSGGRGDQETFHHEGDYRVTEGVIQNLEGRFGVNLLRKYEFTVEDDIPDAIEIGSDQYCIDGQWPPEITVGNEIKDCGFWLTVMALKDAPPQVTRLMHALAPHLKKYGYRNFFSTETRVPKKDPSKSYPIDLTARIASPPGETMMQMASNWPEIFWYGAEGIMVPMKFVAKFGIQAMISSEWAGDDLQAIYFPKELEPWVKLRNSCMADGIHYVIPQPNKMHDIGYVVAVDDDPLKMVKDLKERASQIKGQSIKINIDKIPEALATAHEGEKMGIKFGSAKLPEVAEVAKIVRG